MTPRSPVLKSHALPTAPHSTDVRAALLGVYINMLYVLQMEQRFFVSSDAISSDHERTRHKFTILAMIDDFSGLHYNT